MAHCLILKLTLQSFEGACCWYIPMEACFSETPMLLIFVQVVSKHTLVMFSSGQLVVLGSSCVSIKIGPHDLSTKRQERDHWFAP